MKDRCKYWGGYHCSKDSIMVQTQKYCIFVKKLHL
ncbi:MAG: DUF1540 domain-containing protein [Prevotellaceae bacterium]|nr:DUF1540 domain-containing protein [Prevotellaceae bacterium]